MASSGAALIQKLSTIKKVPACVQLLEKQLISGDPAIREAGLLSITKLKTPQEPLTDLIERLLQHQNWFVRRTAAAAITRCAELPDAAHVAVHTVAAAGLISEDPEVRSCASKALVTIAATAAGGSGIGTAFLQDPRDSMTEIERAMDLMGGAPPVIRTEDPFVFGVAPRGTIDEDFIQLTLQEVAQGLSAENPRVRQLSIESLCKMGDLAEPYVSAVASLLADSDPSVRRAAVETFMLLGVHSVDAVTAVAQLLRHNGEEVRRCAEKAIRNLVAHSGSITIQTVIQQLSIVERIHKSGAAKKQRGGSLPRGSIPNEADTTTARRTILNCLVQYGSLLPPHVKVLVEFLEDSDVAVRASAVRVLIAAGAEVASSTTSLRLIRKRLDHPNIDVRRAAVDVLRGLAPLHANVSNFCAKVLLEDTNDGTPECLRLRAQLIRIFGAARQHAKKHIGEFIADLENSDWQIRRATMEAFVELKEHAEQASPEIARRVINSDPVVRRAAVETIGKMGKHAEQFLPRLSDLKRTEEDEDVLLAIKAILGEMSPATSPGPASPVMRGRRASFHRTGAQTGLIQQGTMQ